MPELVEPKLSKQNVTPEASIVKDQEDKSVRPHGGGQSPDRQKTFDKDERRLGAEEVGQKASSLIGRADRMAMSSLEYKAALVEQSIQGEMRGYPEIKFVEGDTQYGVTIARDKEDFAAVILRKRDIDKTHGLPYVASDDEAFTPWEDEVV